MIFLQLTKKVILRPSFSLDVAAIFYPQSVTEGEVFLKANMLISVKVTSIYSGTEYTIE